MDHSLLSVTNIVNNATVVATAKEDFFRCCYLIWANNHDKIRLTVEEMEQVKGNLYISRRILRLNGEYSGPDFNRPGNLAEEFRESV